MEGVHRACSPFLSHQHWRPGAGAVLTRAPSLTRHSITRAPPLALEAGDTSSEMVEPPKPGTPSDWWHSLRTTSARQRAGSGRLSTDKPQPRLSRGSGGGGGGAAAAAETKG